MSSPLSADDRLDIQAVTARYAWSLDTGDVEGFVACFTPDAVLTWEAFETPDRWTGAAELRAFAEWFKALPGTPGRQHHITNVLIEGEGELARAKSYALVTDRQGEAPYPVRFAGYYEDLLAKANGRWAIRERWIRDWSGPVLKSFPGQSGERVPRARPAELAGRR